MTTFTVFFLLGLLCFVVNFFLLWFGQRRGFSLSQPIHDARGGWTVAGLAIAAGAGAYSANKQAKAAKDALKAGEKAIVDPNEIARVARETARSNLGESAALERQYAPGQQEFRQNTLRQLLAKASGGDSYGDLALASLAKDVQSPQADSGLLADAVAKAKANLALGGKLDVATRNEVTGRSLATAGRVGGGRLDLGRYIAPRDLGLTSLQLGQQRLNDATTLGEAEQNSLTRRTQLRAMLAQALQGGSNAQADRYLQLARFGQGLQAPEGGLSPGDIASLYTGNASNAATAGLNAAKLRAEAAKNTAAIGGQIGGALGGFDWGQLNTNKKKAA